MLFTFEIKQLNEMRGKIHNMRHLVDAKIKQRGPELQFLNTEGIIIQLNSAIIFLEQMEKFLAGKEVKNENSK